MSEWIVYSKDGLTERCRLKRLEYNGSFMNERTISATFEYHSEVAFDVFDYIVYRNEKFELESIPSVKKISNHNYEYELRFVSLKYELERCEMRDIVPKDNGVTYPTPLTFSFTGDVRYLTERIQANLDSLYGEGVWSIVIPEGVKSEEKNITISQQNCWNALSLVNTTYNLTFSIKGRVITVGGEQSLVGHVFQYGKGKGLYEIERVSDTDTGIVTKVRAYGGTRNLDYSYPKRPEWTDSVLPVSFALSPLRLMLPSFKLDGKTDYVLADDSIISEYGIREASVVYDDIYPSITGMLNYDDEPIDEIKSVDEVDDSKDTFIVYLYDLGFDLESNLTTENAQISMKSGSLIGYTFNISEIEKQEDNSYKITLGRITNEEGDTGNFNIPNSQWSIAAGDKFVLLNILMPQEYIRHAEERLLERAKEYLNEYGRTNFSYNVGLHDKFLKENANIYEELIEGSKLRIYDQNLGISEDVTIQSITITENMGDNMLTQVKVTLNNKPSASTIERIQGQIKELSETSAGQFSTQSELLKQYRRKLDKPFFDRLFAAVDINGNEIPSTDMTTPIAYIKARFNFATLGGVTMYLDDKSFNLPSIYDGLPIDHDTIYWENGRLKSKGGGSVDEGAVKEIIESYGYTTEDWVRDYVLENASGGIESITKQMVIEALGFTPYSAENPNGYITAASIPSALKNPYALTFGSKTYDGSVEQTILASDLGALTSHQTIYTLTFQSGTFASGSFTANSGNKTINIPTTTSHISEGDNLYFTNARVVSALADTLKSYVTLSGTQTISGEKNFTGGLKVNGSPIVYDASKKYWKLEGDLLVTGGVTMYGSDSSFTPSTIMDAIAVDGTTISKEGGVLRVIGGGSGSISEITKQMVIDALGFTPISSSDVPTALPNPHSLKFGSKLYDGSASKTILASDLGITWDDIFGRPTLLSSFTDDVVAGKYLPLSGGTITIDSIYSLSVKRNGTGGSFVAYENNNGNLGFLGVGDDGVPKFAASDGVGKKIWHEGNFIPANYLPLSGGTISGFFAINGSIAAYTQYKVNNAVKGEVGWHSSYGIFIKNETSEKFLNITDEGLAQFDGNSLIHSGNIGSYALPLSGGAIKGDLIIGSGNTETWIHYFKEDINTKFGAIGVSSSHEPLFNDNTTVHTIIHSGNYSSYALPLSGGTISEGLTIGGTLYATNNMYLNGWFSSKNHYFFVRDNADADWIVTNENWTKEYSLIHSGNIGSQSVNYANNALRMETVLGHIDGTSIHDLNTVIGGGDVYNYGDPNYWRNAPKGIKYGRVWNLVGSFRTDLLNGQLAWDINHNSTTDTTNGLWWRAIQNADRVSYAKWHQIAFTDSDITGNAATATYATSAGNANTLDSKDSTDFFRILDTNYDLNSIGDKNKKNGVIYINSSHAGTSNAPFNYGSVLSVNVEASSWMLGCQSNGILMYRNRWWSDNGTNWSDWKTIAFTDSNVASATKLQTARTIWGQSFDGTGDVNGILTINSGGYINGKDGNGYVRNILELSSNNTFYLGYSSASAGGNTYLHGNNIMFRCDTSRTERMRITSSGNVLIGTTTDSGYKLDVNGTIRFAPRTIWGQSFDGTGNVDGVMTASSTNNQIIVGSSSYTSGVIRATQMLSPTLTASYGICHLFGKELSNYNTGNIVFNWVGDSNQNNRVSIGLYGADNLLNILGSGNVGIGTTNPLDKLHVAGNLRLKNEDSFYGNYIYFGDDRYCYIGGTTDDSMTIYASKGIQLNGKVNIASDTTIDGNLLVRGGITMYRTDGNVTPFLIDVQDWELIDSMSVTQVYTAHVTTLLKEKVKAFGEDVAELSESLDSKILIIKTALQNITSSSSVSAIGAALNTLYNSL